MLIAALLIGAGAGYTLGSSKKSREVSLGGPLSAHALERSSTGELGMALLARVGARLVADDRVGAAEQGLRFFDTPKPYGEWLCRVNAYSVPAKIVTGKLAYPQDFWADDLSVKRLYGIWRRPTVAPRSRSRDKACAAYRDFGHLFVEEGVLAASRGAYLLDVLLTDAAAGRLPFPATCASLDDGGQTRPCDARAVLRGRSLKDLGRVEQLDEKEFEHEIRWSDRLTLRGDSRDVLIDIEVVSDQHFGRQSADEADVRSIAVAVGRIR